MEATDRLVLDYIREHPYEYAGEIATGVRLPVIDVARSLQRLRSAGKVEQAGRGYRVTR